MTGYFRDGYCRTADHDIGTHVIAAVVTDEFLQYSRSLGNDLITPHPPSFPGCVQPRCAAQPIPMFLMLLQSRSLAKYLLKPVCCQEQKLSSVPHLVVLIPIVCDELPFMPSSRPAVEMQAPIRSGH